MNPRDAERIARVLLQRWEPIACASPWDNEPAAPRQPEQAWQPQLLSAVWLSASGGAA